MVFSNYCCQIFLLCTISLYYFFNLPVFFTSRFVFSYEINDSWITMSFLKFSASLVNCSGCTQNLLSFFPQIFQWLLMKKVLTLTGFKLSAYFSNYLTPLPDMVPVCMLPFLKCHIWDFIFAYVFNSNEWFYVRLFKNVGLIIKTLFVKLNMRVEWQAWSADICRYSTFSSQFFIVWLLVSPGDPYRVRNIISALFLHSARKEEDLELLWLPWEFCFE